MVRALRNLFILYPVAQAAYRRNHSTEAALLKVMNDNVLNMNSSTLLSLYCLISVLLSIPLITVFFLIDYRQKLDLNGTALDWF